MKQHRPYSAQIELVRGCNRKCDFCAIHCLPSEIVFMPDDIILKTAQELAAFDPLRIELAMRGEPTLHPKWIEYVKILRDHLPKSSIMLCTNGIKLTPKKVEQFWEAGGNVAYIDCYDGTYLNTWSEYLHLNPKDFYTDKCNPYHRKKPEEKILLLMDDLGENNRKTQNRVIVNQAGNVSWDLVEKYGVFPLKEPLEKVCVNPFREIVIHYDGKIPLCCRDWREKNILYHITKGNLEDYWYNDPELNKIRRMLKNKNRNHGICKVCDFKGGMRIGILPEVSE